MSKTRKIRTTVIGSYPRHSSLVGNDFDVNWLVSPGDNLDKAWRDKENLLELQENAIRWAVKEQESAGLDIVTDGEQRRGNFVLYHCQHLNGFDFANKQKKSIRGKTRTELVPTIRREVSSKKPFLVEEYEFLKSLTNKQVKVTIPGPLTIIDSSKNLHYNDESELAFDLAKAIREEVKTLVHAGCKIIQFDEPAFIREPKKFFDYGLNALQECFKGINNLSKGVHICRGYPNKEKDIKAEIQNYSDAIEALSTSKIDTIAVEDAHEHLDLQMFEKFGSKEIVLGTVEIGGRKIETAEEIERRIRNVLEVVSPEKLLVAPDCGLLLLKPETARAKLVNMVKAAENVRKEC